MEVMLAIERVLKLGCGKDLKKVLRSKHYDTLMKLSGSLFERHPAKSDTGIALRAGHLEFGRLINTLDERTALSVAKDVRPTFGQGLELRPLIQIVGESLVRSARECLTEEMKGLAIEWKSSSAERQIEIAREMFTTLRSVGQDSKGDLSVESAWTSVRSSHEANSYSEEKVLPRQYGLWNPATNVANCQGKTQMLVAFARLAKARVVTLHPIQDSKQTERKIRSIVFKIVTDDLIRRNITEIDETFQGSLQGFVIDNEFKESQEFFHVCVAIEIRDGRWVLIDPHGLNFGVFPNEWDMPSIANTLERYKEVLPGLSMMATDKDRHMEIVESARTNVIDLMNRSRRLEEALSDATSPADIANALVETGELWLIMKRLCGESEEAIEKVRANKVLTEYVSLSISIGTDIMESMIAGMSGMEGVSRYMRKRKHVALSTYHCIAMNESREWSERGDILHPRCEINNAEYSVAIAAINSLVNRGKGVNRFFLEHSFDQTTLHNALSEFWRGWNDEQDKEVGMVAARLLQSLPFRHPLCSRRLALLRL